MLLEIYQQVFGTMLKNDMSKQRVYLIRVTDTHHQNCDLKGFIVIEKVPALAGRFSTTAPPGKPPQTFLKH